MKRIFIISNTAWYLYNFRLALMEALAEQGYVPVAVAPYDSYADKIQAAGFSFIPLEMDNKGVNPIQDLRLLGRLYWLLRTERPVVVLGYTAKPNIYASLAAASLNIPVVNNISGLGSAFIQGGAVASILKVLYRLALRRSKKVFFQNDDDMHFFFNAGLVRKEVADRLPGSGVDTVRFAPRMVPLAGEKFVFLLVARMLRDKGVGEFVEAARVLKARYPHVECQLLGSLDAINPTSIPKENVNTWVEEGVVKYLGTTDDVAAVMAAANCVVLPSYREGTPRTLLEAASLAKPIVTTDAIGCREVVTDGVNGFLCRVKDAADLAIKMEQMLLLPKVEREAMGQRGRQRMLAEFDEKIVIDRYLAVVKSVN